MGTTHLFQFHFQYLNPFRIDSPPPPTQTNPKFLTRRNSSNNGRCRCTRSGGREGGSRWYSDDTSRSKPFNFNLDDDEVDDDDGAFGFNSATKKRIWWSGDVIFDDYDEDEDEDDDGFGVLEGSISGIAWITKVLKAFGWMVPAILLSMLVGTGPNAFFMALALPLAQSALSLVFDTFWGRPNDKSRTKRRPFARAATNVGTRKEKDTSTGNEASFKKGAERSSSNFGGWDDLDEQKRTDKAPFTTQTRKSTEQSQPKKGKLSRTLRKQEKPLALRLLIAIFPFLGSWTRFL